MNSKDVEYQYWLEDRIFDTDAPEFLAVNPNFHGREGFGLKRTWPRFGRGTRLAYYLMELAIQSNGPASYLDFIQLLEVDTQFYLWSPKGPEYINEIGSRRRLT